MKFRGLQAQLSLVDLPPEGGPATLQSCPVMTPCHDLTPHVMILLHHDAPIVTMWSHHPLPRQSNLWLGHMPSTAVGALCAGCYLANLLVYTIGESENYIYIFTI
jgi:hypothetical protein